MTKKKLLRLISFIAKSGEVSTAPPIGPLLGQFPIDVRNFCNAFNAETARYDKGLIVKVDLYLYKDGTFTFIIDAAPISFLCELASKPLDIPTYRVHYFISLIDLYKIFLIKTNKIKKLEKKYSIFFTIMKQAKILKYKIIENIKENNYILYL